MLHPVMRRLALAAICLVAFAMDTGYAVVHYLTYHAPPYDLGFFDNVVAHPWDTVFVKYSFLGQHWEPLLLVATLLNHITPSPIWLLLIQGVALALAPVGAYLLAASWLPSRTEAPLIAAMVAVVHPILGRAAFADFHMEALTPALTLFALAAAARRRNGLVLLCCALLLLTKEDATLVVVGIGLIIWRIERRPRLGLALVGAGVAAAAVLVGVLMPHWRGGESGDLVPRYAYLGGTTPGDIARGAVTHPVRAIKQLFSPDARQGALLALAPLAFLPLIGGVGLLACALPLVVALLSNHQPQTALEFHYGLESLGLLLAAALLGWRRIDGWCSAHGWNPPGRVVGASLAAAAVLGYVAVSPLPGGRAFDMHQVSGLERHAEVEAVLKLVPPEGEVTASTGLVTHLTHRKAAVFEFGGDGFGAEWAVIDTAEPPTPTTVQWGYYDELKRLPSRYVQVASAGGVTLWHVR